MEKNKPICEFRDGTVKSAIFEREVNGKNKKPFKSQSVALQISYTDKKGKWVNKSLTIVKNDLRKVLNVLVQTREELGISA